VSALSSAAGHTALLESNDGALAEVYALEAGKLRKLTAHNDAFLAELQLGAVEDIRFKSKDGIEIHGLVVKPPSFVPGRKYPTCCGFTADPTVKMNTLWFWTPINSNPRCLRPRGSSCCA